MKSKRGTGITLIIHFPKFYIFKSKEEKERILYKNFLTVGQEVKDMIADVQRKIKGFIKNIILSSQSIHNKVQFIYLRSLQNEAETLFLYLMSISLFY
jgi:hypothetical protein